MLNDLHFTVAAALGWAALLCPLWVLRSGSMPQYQPEVGAAVVALPAGGVYAAGSQP